jgi:aerobic-type carbon monoxide dehydrogenase small subunit (CoxS/CutS family)
MNAPTISIACRVNGVERKNDVEPRLLLSDFLRHELGLTGTHVGCEHGVCGACTVIVDGAAVRSCLLFAVQVDGSDIRTVEGLVGPDDSLGHIQQAFKDQHGLQCGFCTPGILMSLAAMEAEPGAPSREGAMEVIGGHLCRCTGYRNIVRAAEQAFGLEAGAEGSTR